MNNDKSISPFRPSRRNNMQTGNPEGLNVVNLLKTDRFPIKLGMTLGLELLNKLENYTYFR